MEIGKDNEESRVAAGVQCVQVQNAAYPETLQTVRAVILLGSAHTDRSFSFELGGEKKTKGAALTFVRPFVFLATLRGSLHVFSSSERLIFYFYVAFILHCHTTTNMICLHANSV